MSTQPASKVSRTLDGAPCVAAVVSGACHRIEFGNAAFLRFFGSGRADGSAKWRPQLADGRLSARVDEVLASGRGRRIRGVRVRAPSRNRQAPGSVRYFDLVLEPAHGDPIPARSVLVVGVEVTRRVRSEQRLRAQRRHYAMGIDVSDHVDALLAMRRPVERPVVVADGPPKRAVESQQRLVRGFGHDIRNALNAADGHAQILENLLLGPLTDEQLQSVARLRGLLHSAASLVADVLRAARAEPEPPVVRPVPADLLAIVVEAVQGHSAAAVLKKLDLTLEHADDQFRTRTDPARVRQALDNLLSNAVKFTEHGSIAVRIRRQRGREPDDGRDWIAISVSDTGPGIPASSRACVFDEFVRLRPSAHEGVGIGLSISRRIAELIGATITLESEEGRGSVFTLWLPVESLPPDESDRLP